jgi:hypothetical protein
MGTWDTGPFDNDTAADWTYELEETDDLSFIEETLDAALAISASESVPPEVGECAIAAADTLARLQGSVSSESAYTETVDEWVKAHRLKPSPALIAKAKAALARITTEPSELLDVWNETDDGGGWSDSVQELSDRLR